MSKLDELVKNWLSQGKVREWTDVVELIQQLQEEAYSLGRLEEREAMRKLVEGKKSPYKSIDKSQETLAEWAAIELGKEIGHNSLREDLLNELNKN